MIKKISYILMCIFFSFTLVASAASKNQNSYFEAPKQKSALDSASDMATKVDFLTEDNKSYTCDNGLLITYLLPLAFINTKNYGENFYSFSDAYGSYTVAVQGISLVLKNTSNQVVVVRWAESAISVGTYSGTPFLDGMKYSNAGNPSATPDTIIPPGQRVTKDIYLPRTEFDSYWKIIGEPLPKKDGLTFNLSLKIVDGNGSSKYISMPTPLIGIPIK